MKRKFVAAVLAGIMIFSLAACGDSKGNTQEGGEESSGNKAEPEGQEAEESIVKSGTEGGGDVTLRLAWLGTGQDKETLDKCLQKYTDKTGIGVETVYIPGSWTEYFTKMQTMIAGGDYIDCAYVAIEGFEMFVDTGMAAPIDDWIAGHKEEYQSTVNDIDQNIMDKVTFDGKVYAIPEEWNNVVTHFNTKLLEEAGLSLPAENWTKDEFLDYCDKLTKEKDGVKQYGVYVPDYYFGVEAWLYNNGAGYMNDDFTESTINSPESVEVFQLMQDLIHKYGYAPIPEKNVDAIQQLIDGNVAMGFWGGWPTNNYNANDFKDVAVQYIPSFSQNQPIWGGGGIFTMKESRHSEEAASLANYIGSADFIEEFMAAGAIPVLNSVAKELVPELGYPENNQIFYESASTAKAVHSPVQYPECEALVSRVISDILVNKADVQTTLDAAAEEMNSYLMDNLE
ncbi:sugar ABC transporter substrate-binding protein [Blautia coccoides]|uniref:ABC transporter substrate-binding protein n=1 Tax=Blautia producta TaxID=33035 RepID=UPI00210C98EA|nr:MULTISPECIES: sugar ABC transporter substrate-binding protein [Blautia]MCQ5124996.1 sugar ABC transporter substrate-binding protein [Blautia producta]MDT4374648.1 sugar ABC transporter substrate-binding protein [Blautia coccoides]